MKIEEMTNSELVIAIKKSENEYEVLKNKIKTDLNKLNEIDEKYLAIKREMSKRKLI